MEAKCPNCKEIRKLKNLKPFFMSNGTSAVRGQCVVCSNLITKSGRIPEHDKLPQPPKKPKPIDGKDNPKPPRSSVPKPVIVPTRNGPPLVIVESPTKAKTIGKFLGRKFQVKASIGHIRDLPKNRLGVDLEHDFEPSYVIPMDKKKTVKELQVMARDAKEIWLATDPDREGEAISWHLTHALKDEISGKPVKRVEFHEITQHAINEAFANPREIDNRRVNAQQARRVLDRLVGYTLSPLLRDKMGRKGLSAGRVQSVALRLVCEREREIMSFVPIEYWVITADLAKLAQNGIFTAQLNKINGIDADVRHQNEATAIVTVLNKANYSVAKVERKDKNRRPAAPFTTSTLQQEASRKLNFNAKRAMAVAQQLYEGIDVGEGAVGLITYMRTDSTNVSTMAQDEARKFIAERYGANFMPSTPPKYTTRAKNAQEAHEAIRPTSVFRTPDAVIQYLDKDQFRLYDLIWKRFVASQMSNAIFDTTTVDVSAMPNARDKQMKLAFADASFMFRANGSIIKFQGFLRVYEEGRDESSRKDDDDEGIGKRLPPLEANEPLRLDKLNHQQKFTQPPPRYTEASLIKALEEYGIGRPSTYASIMTVILSRFYVEREAKNLKPTALGFQVNDLLVGNFSNYIDVNFTAHVEDELDTIETGNILWQPVIHEFYDPFKQAVDHAALSLPKVEKLVEFTGEACPKCGKPLQYKQSRYGRFIGCSDYPRCDFTEPLSIPGVACPKCGGKLAEKRVKSKTKGVRVFYGCLNYPTCDFTTWNKPVAMTCPNCAKGLVVETGKEKGKCLNCESTFALVANELVTA
jgi:DNA topoisomerase-1